MRVNITTAHITLGQLLKLTGLAATGAHAKEMIAAGLCSKGGEIVRERGRKLYPGDLIRVDGTDIEIAAE